MIEHLLGFFAPWGLFALILALQALVPARRAEGYARDEISNEPIIYRLNGLPVFLLVVAAWFMSGYTGLVPYEWLWQHRWSGLAGAFALGLIASSLALHNAPAQSASWLKDYFLGRKKNPSLAGGRVDAKMYLYAAGAIVLELNLLSFAAHHVLNHPTDFSLGVILYVCLFTWFICEYLVFEHVHLYTYDLFAERLGFKLVGGCLVFYPYFYGIGLWATADLPNPDSPTWYLVLSAAVFFSGWVLARGANMQKYYFKRDPSHVFLGLIKPQSISDGERHVLCSGFWGLSRHINYLGEVLMATGLTLSLGWPWLIVPWLYPLYYAVFLPTRERDDDHRCEEKYGELWRQYREKVPRRIIPYVY